MSSWTSKLIAHSIVVGHTGGEAQPHFILPSGMHCGKYVDTRLLYRDQDLFREASGALYDRFAESKTEGCPSIDCFVGEQIISCLFAKAIMQIYMREAGAVKECRLASHRFEYSSDEHVPNKVVFAYGSDVGDKDVALICQSVVWGEEETRVLVDDIQRKGAIVVPHILAVVNASGSATICGMNVIALETMQAIQYEEAPCPLCKQGSKAVDPRKPPVA